MLWIWGDRQLVILQLFALSEEEGSKRCQKKEEERGRVGNQD